MKELAATGGAAGVVLLGDMNDDLGMDDAEKQAGADAMADLVAPEADGFVLETKPLIDKGEFSFGGYWKTDHRSLIDHIVVTPGLKDRVRDVQVFKGGLSRVASDHYPVFAKMHTDGPAVGAATR
jgi:endonuclease/exonuclease/phosphatase family metal-dependent hydrolase